MAVTSPPPPPPMHSLPLGWCHHSDAPRPGQPLRWQPHPRWTNHGEPSRRRETRQVSRPWPRLWLPGVVSGYSGRPLSQELLCHAILQHHGGIQVYMYVVSFPDPIPSFLASSIETLGMGSGNETVMDCVF